MSSAAIAAPEPVTRGAPERSERTAGKGRRRRAAAEQRRIELQRWGQYLNDEDEAVMLAHLPGNRRRIHRSSRRNSARDDLEDFLDGMVGADFMHSPPSSNASTTELDVALALSLSLSDTALGGSSSGMTVLQDMSYESLVMLENVRCVAPEDFVNSLATSSFTGKNKHPEQTCETCAICQCDYENADLLIKLPCAHNFHHGCGAEWLLKYSKLCPVCKHDMTE